MNYMNRCLGLATDPTILFKSDGKQPAEVDEEKRIYVTANNFYKSKFDMGNISKTGFFFGAHGTLTNSYYIKYYFRITYKLCQ